MRGIIRFLVLVCALFSIGAIFYFVLKMDEETVEVNLADQLAVSAQGDSLARQELLDTNEMKPTALVSTLFQDYEVRVVLDSLIWLKGNSILAKEIIGKGQVQQILLSDLNENDAPECWIVIRKPNQQINIRAMEYVAGRINRINFPKLKGSQAFGYVGSDSLFLDKTGIVRQFIYVDDPYADLSSGKRACYYQFGKDQSFILKKTLETE